MKCVYFLPVILAAAVSSLNCGKNNRSARYRSGNRQPQPPAETAEEWQRRLDSPTSFEDCYAELPPIQEWDAVIRGLRQQGSGHRHFKPRLLGEALADDADAASLSIRGLLLRSPDKMKEPYDRKEALRYLHTFSKDPEEARQWVGKSLPKEEPDLPNHSESKDEIRMLLAEERIDEALAKLRAKIEDDAGDPFEKLETLNRLVRIARLTGRSAIHEQGVREMKSTALEFSGNSQNCSACSLLPDQVAQGDGIVTCTTPRVLIGCACGPRQANHRREEAFPLEAAR